MKPYKIISIIGAHKRLLSAQNFKRSVTAYGTNQQRNAAEKAVSDALAAYKAAAAELSALIADTEGRARVRCLTVDDILDAVDRVPKVIRKKSLVGCIIKDYDPHAQSFPGAYKGIPESTKASLAYRPSGWYLVDIRRSRCTSDGGRLILSGAAKADIIAAIEKL